MNTPIETNIREQFEAIDQAVRNTHRTGAIAARLRVVEAMKSLKASADLLTTTAGPLVMERIWQEQHKAVFGETNATGQTPGGLPAPNCSPS